MNWVLNKQKHQEIIQEQKKEQKKERQKAVFTLEKVHESNEREDWEKKSTERRKG